MNWTLLANSALVAGGVTSLALLFGLAVAVVLTFSSAAMRGVLYVATLAVLAAPAFLVTNCWIDLLGANGPWHSFLPFNIFSLAGTIWILSLLLWPIPAFGIFGAWRKLEPAHFEIDLALRGASLFRVLLWPACRSVFAIAAAIVFALALNNFSVPAILQVKVFPSEMWVQFNTHLDAGAALLTSWPMIVAPLLLLIALRHVDVPWPRECASDIAPVLRRQLGVGVRVASVIICVLVLVVSLVVPLAQLALTPRTWSELGPAFFAGRAALANSFIYAAGAAASTVCLALITARQRSLRGFWICFLTPGVFLGIGALVLLNRPGLDFISRTIVIVLFVLAVRYFALAHAFTRATYQSLDRDLIDSARLDGARRLVLFRRVILPQIGSSLAAAAYFVYVLCLWDVETILLVVPPGGETLALRIFNLLHYGHNAHVNALCLLLLLLALAPLIIFAVAVAVKRRFASMCVASILILTTVGCRDHAGETAPVFPIQSSIFSHVEVVGGRGTGAGEFNKPRSLTFDTNDNLYVVDMTGRVQKFSPDGKFLLSWQMPQTDLGKPKGMCRDREGNIVVLEPHYQRVSHFTPEGKLVAQWGVKGTNAGELTLPRSIAVDTKNNVIVSEYTLVDRVQKFSPRGGRCLAAWGVPGLGAGEFNRAEGISVDARDNIYVADSCNHRIQIFSNDGKFLRAHGKAGDRAGEVSYPYDVAVDKQGRQYVCEFGNSRIQVFDRDDKPLEIIGKAGGDLAQFANPWSVALDSQGNLYVADSMNHRVQKLVRKKEGSRQYAVISAGQRKPSDSSLLITDHSPSP